MIRTSSRNKGEKMKRSTLFSINIVLLAACIFTSSIYSAPTPEQKIDELLRELEQNNPNEPVVAIERSHGQTRIGRQVNPNETFQTGQKNVARPLKKIETPERSVLRRLIYVGAPITVLLAAGFLIATLGAPAVLAFIVSAPLQVGALIGLLPASVQMAISSLPTALWGLDYFLIKKDKDGNVLESEKQTLKYKFLNPMLTALSYVAWFQAISLLINPATSIAQGAGSMARTVFSNPLGAVGSVATAPFSAAGSAAQGALGVAGSAAQGALGMAGKVGSAIADPLGTGKAIAGGAVSVVGGAASAVVDPLATGQAIIGGTTSVVGAAMGAAAAPAATVSGLMEKWNMGQTAMQVGWWLAGAGKQYIEDIAWFGSKILRIGSFEIPPLEDGADENQIAMYKQQVVMTLLQPETHFFEKMHAFAQLDSDDLNQAGLSDDEWKKYDTGAGALIDAAADIFKELEKKELPVDEPEEEE